MYKFFVVGIHSDKWITCVCCNSTLVVEIPTHQYVALHAPTESPAENFTGVTIYISKYNIIYCAQISFRDTNVFRRYKRQTTSTTNRYESPNVRGHPFMTSTRKFFPSVNMRPHEPDPSPLWTSTCHQP